MLKGFKKPWGVGGSCKNHYSHMVCYVFCILLVVGDVYCVVCILCIVGYMCIRYSLLCAVLCVYCAASCVQFQLCRSQKSVVRSLLHLSSTSFFNWGCPAGLCSVQLAAKRSHLVNISARVQTMSKGGRGVWPNSKFFEKLFLFWQWLETYLWGTTLLYTHGTCLYLECVRFETA